MNAWMVEHIRQVVFFLDATAIVTIVGVLIGYLPTATAILTFLWVAVRLYETKTVQRIIHGKTPSNNAG